VIHETLSHVARRRSSRRNNLCAYRRTLAGAAVIALIGLFGMLLGEQIPPLVKGYLQQKPAGHSWLHQQVRPHMFGHLPRGRDTAGTQLAQSARNDTSAHP
jgi:xanthosine utilization system XapX-like protein